MHLQFNSSELVFAAVWATPLYLVVLFAVFAPSVMYYCVSASINYHTVAFHVCSWFIYVLFVAPIMRVYFSFIYISVMIRWYGFLSVWFSNAAETTIYGALFAVLLPVLIGLYLLLACYMFKIAPQLDKVMSSRIFALIYFSLLLFGLAVCGVIWLFDFALSTVSIVHYLDDDPFIHSYTLCQFLWAGNDHEALAYCSSNRDELNLEMQASGQMGDYWREQVNLCSREASLRNPIWAHNHVPKSPMEGLANVQVLPVKYKGGVDISKTYLIPKYLQRRGFPADSLQIVGYTTKIVSVDSLQEDKVTYTDNIGGLLDKTAANASHQQYKGANVPTQKFYVTNPLGLAKSILLQVPEAENAYVGLVKLATSSKDLHLDLYPTFSAEEFATISDNLLSKGMTASRVIESRNSFIANDLGWNKHVKRFNTLPQVGTNYLKFHNTRVINIAQRLPCVSFGAQLKTVLSQVIKKV
jgi:hypothetical protein